MIISITKRLLGIDSKTHRNLKTIVLPKKKFKNLNWKSEDTLYCPSVMSIGKDNWNKEWDSNFFKSKNLFLSTGWNLSLLFQFDPRRFFQVRNSSVAKFQMLFVFRFSRRFRVECLYYCWKMQNVINAVKGTALNVAEKFTPVLKVGIVQQIVR